MENKRSITLLLTIALLQLRNGADAQSSSGLGEGRDNECLGLFDTHQQGVYVCDNHRDLVPALKTAEMIGREQCEKSFAGEKWNCSGFSILKAPNITSRATREAAYVHALSLAAIAYSVAKICVTGDVTSCTCSQTSLKLPTGSEERQYTIGCSDNVSFGVNFAFQFLRLRLITDEKNEEDEEGVEEEKEEKEETDTATRVFLHNLQTAAEVARMSIMRTPPCRCVGVSSACTILSCHEYSFSEFSIIAKQILDLYNNHICQYSTSEPREEDEEVEKEEENSGQESESNQTRTWFGTEDDLQSGSWSHTVVVQTVRQQGRQCADGSKQLVYLEESPNYCVRDLSVGSLGTRGRECNPNSTGTNSCQRLCSSCGWSHRNVTQVVEKNCHCSFIYCCEIKCHKCFKNRVTYQCNI